MKNKWNYRCTKCGVTYTNPHTPLTYSECVARVDNWPDVEYCGGKLKEI